LKILLQLTENEVKSFVPRDDLAYAEAPEDDKLLETQRKVDRFVCLVVFFSKFKVSGPFTLNKRVVSNRFFYDRAFYLSLIVVRFAVQY